MFCKVSPEIISGLMPAKTGPRAPEKWMPFYLHHELGGFPLRLRFIKESGDITPEKIYWLVVQHRKAGHDSDGHGYAIDHEEFNFYVPRHSPEQMGVEKTIHTLTFAHCDKSECVNISPKPFRMWRFSGKKNYGIVYLYDPSQEIKISRETVHTEILDSFPVKVSAVGVEPLKKEENSTIDLKYAVEGVPVCLYVYDRRKDHNSSGLLEVVKKTTEKRSWIYLGLKDASSVPSGTAELTANEDHTALVVKKGGEIFSFESYLGDVI